MTITLELSPKEEAKLKARAALRGVDIKTYLLELSDRMPAAAPAQIDLARFKELLSLVAKPGPGLPDEALTSEGIYGEYTNGLLG